MDRMLRRAMDLWDLPDTETLDPVVRLLLEALSEEIFMLAGEVDDMDRRLLGELSLSMTPVTNLTARPAHAILWAEPVEGTVTVDHNTIFEYKEMQQLRKYGVDYLRFSPLTSFTLRQARIKYLKIGRRLYGYGEDCRKYPVVHFPSTDQKENCVWIGLDVRSQEAYIEELPFYFDFPNVPNKYDYLQALTHTQWTISDKVLASHAGLPSRGDGDNELFQSPASSLREDLLSIYDLHYVCVQGIDPHQRTPYPEEWATALSEEDRAQFADPLVWIRIFFPAHYSSDVLNSLKVGVNFFPVGNVFRRTSMLRMSDIPMYMPLNLGNHESFIGLESVRDSSGVIYESLSRQRGAGGPISRTYTLRHGGIEGLDRKSDMSGAVDRLTDIIRDHIVVSNAKGVTELKKVSTELQMLTDKIRYMLHDVRQRQLTTYVTVDRSNPGEMLIAEYWVTHADIVNDFRQEAPLVARDLSAALQENIEFKTPLRGGAASPSEEQIQNAHRYMLTSHDRIFTMEDIKNYCHAEYGRMITDVRVDTGIAISPHPQQGLIRTIDIYLQLDKEIRCSDSEAFKTDLLCKLKRRSPDLFNYRIFISQ